MDGPRTMNDGNGVTVSERSGRRRRSEMPSANVRYFLLKPGATADKPELGAEMPSEGEALVHAFKSGQVFLTLVAWKAVPELTEAEPRIVKQPVLRS